MITRENLSDIIGFNSEPYLTTTLYLQIQGTSQQAHLIELKDLIKEGRKELERQVLPAEIRNSAQADLREIQDFVSLKFSRDRVRTLVIFSCAGRKWWHTLNLHIPMRSSLTVNSRPYHRPISLLLDERHRFLTVLVERSKARLFEVYAGDIEECSSILDEVPGKVRVGGFSGYEERRIERHIEDHVRRHFRHVAGAAYDEFQRRSCNRVILAGTEQNTGEFQHYLHSGLQDRIAAKVVMDIHASPVSILENVGNVEQNIRREEEKRLLARFFNEVNSGGLGIVGLDSTLKALRRGQVNSLLVQEGFGTGGFKCPDCRSLHCANGTCDACGAQTHPVEDLVEETVEEALQQGCEVRFITLPDSHLIQAGRIGATLRFKA